MEEIIVKHQQQDNSNKLYEASIRGSVTILHNLRQKDPLILDRISLTSQTETPLHISSLLGHIDFTKALLHHNPNLSSHLNSQKQSPLHLASANGHLEIVQALLSVNKDVCLVQDQYGRVPLHLAAMRGRVEVIKELVRAFPESSRVKVNGDTVLHLCVRYNHLEALQVLVEDVGEGGEFLNLVDNDGNTIFQLAALLKQVQTIKYLASIPGIKVEAEALEKMITNHPSNPQAIPIPVSTIASETISNPTLPKQDQNNATPQQPGVPQVQYQQPLLPPPYWNNIWGRYLDYQGDWLEKARGNIMLVATIIAQMAFQVSINPPGGVWDRDAQLNCPQNAKSCDPGTSILASTHHTSTTYHYFIICNTISFSSSLSIILLLVSGFPLRRRFFMWVLMAAMSFTIFFVAATYMISAKLVEVDGDETFKELVLCYEKFWLVLLGIVVLFYVITLVMWFLKCLLRCIYGIVVCLIGKVKKLCKLVTGKPSTSKGPPRLGQPATVV